MGNCTPQHTRHTPFCETLETDLIRELRGAKHDYDYDKPLEKMCSCYDAFSEEERAQCKDRKWKCNGGEEDLAPEQIISKNPECAGWVRWSEVTLKNINKGLQEEEEEEKREEDEQSDCVNLVENLNALLTASDFSGKQSDMYPILCPCYNGFASQDERDSCLDKSWKCLEDKEDLDSACEGWLKYVQRTFLDLQEKYPDTLANLITDDQTQTSSNPRATRTPPARTQDDPRATRTPPARTQDDPRATRTPPARTQDDPRATRGLPLSHPARTQNSREIGRQAELIIQPANLEPATR